MKYIVYVENESDELLRVNPEDYVNPCDTWLDCLSLLMEYLVDDQEFYEWSDETCKEMVLQFVNDGMADMLNGRFFYAFAWDGKADPIKLAIAHNAARCGKS